MNNIIETVNLIYYSPTGTTRKICREIGRNLGVKHISENNIADNIVELTDKACSSCLTIIGMPVYGGRLPINVIESLNKLRSNQSPVIIVVVYGNRHYDDSLLELRDIASNCGFKIIAAAAFIGEHSYSTDEKPIAKDRPDIQDLQKCREFAQLIVKKLKEVNSLLGLQIPGSYPYKERKQFSGAVHPETDQKLCTLCGICAEVCPVNAISIQELVITNPELCTLCCACVKVCPDNARVYENIAVNAIRENLFVNCSIRKEPLFFI